MNLTPVIEGVLVFWSDRICSRIKNRWASLGIKGNAETDFYILGNVKGAIVSRIFGLGQKMWLAEYGSGSRMDRDNPYLEKYLRSSEFNQWRLHSSRMPIMGRSAGEYKDIDGNTHSSTGKLAGFDLERDGKPEFQPQEPMHVMREEVTAALPEISEDLSKAISKAVADDITAVLTAKIYV